jgi:NitT/TauT family transport system substrate-binding protein
MRARGSTAVALAGAMLLLAACGSSDDGGSDGNATSNAAAPGTPEKAAVTVGVLPLADYAAVYWADDHGFFEKEGLDVTLQPLQGGPIGIQSVVSGAVDFSFANTISTMVAQSAGAPVTIVVASSALGPQSNIYVVKPDSPITSIKDLDGKTVGVNTTNNIGDVTFKALAKSEGVKVAPQFVEVPFNEMVAGVQAGSIDVGYTPEPFASAALAAGLRTVVDLTEGPNKGLAAASFVASDAFVKENPGTAAAFARALYAAGDDISANEAEFRTWLPGIAHVPDEVAQTMKLPTFFTKIEPDELQRVADLLDDQGVLKSEYVLDDHILLP